MLLSSDVPCRQVLNKTITITQSIILNIYSLAIAFLAASLSTNHWIYGDVQRLTNPSESDGYVHFGLFNGKRELNVGYGWRSYPISGIIFYRNNYYL